MGKNEFKDRLFNVINESDELELKDIETSDKGDTMLITAMDGSEFELKVRQIR